MGSPSTSATELALNALTDDTSGFLVPLSDCAKNVSQSCDANGQPIFPPTGLENNQLDKIQQELLEYCHFIQPPYFPRLSIEKIDCRCIH